MPDFGVRTALSEFGKAVEGRRFKHPETDNQVLYTSLPTGEQHRIYEQWKQYQAMVGEAPKEGVKVKEVKSLKKGDKLTIQSPKSKIEVVVTGQSGGRALAHKVDPETGEVATDETFSISQEAIDAFEIRKEERGESKREPFKNKSEWAPVDLKDLYADDAIAYRHGDKDRMGRVVKVSPDQKTFWTQEIDPRSGKVLSKEKHSFDAQKIKERDARLVDMEDAPGAPKGYAGGPAGWEPKKPLTPEEKAKAEEERKRKEAARKKAVEKMGETGKPVGSAKAVKVGDVISYHHDGDVYHGRVIDARGHAFFTIDIDPETGRVKEHGFERWGDADVKHDDAHKVEAEHIPDDPREENERELYEGLPKLEEAPNKYFQHEKDAELVELGKIKPAKVRLKGVLNGNEMLAMAAKGKGGKRKPISLVDDGDGTYTIRDGNSTYTNASLSEWKRIPAIIKTEEQWKEHDRKEEERKKQQLTFPAFWGGPRVTKKKPPKKKPESFKGDTLESTEGLEKGDLFGYEFGGAWFVGRVDRVSKDGQVHVDSLHPDNGELTTLQYVRFDDDKLKDAKAVRLKADHKFPKKKPRLPPKKKDKGKGKGKAQSGKPFVFASREGALEEMRTLIAELKEAYRPRWQDTPGVKTVVDEKSQLGISPSQTESTSPDRGQSNQDSAWPVQAPQPREKERALPLPSNHSKGREKRIGPTVFNKPRKSPDRTLSEPGAEYGHPTKYDYHMPTRRNELTALEDDDIYEEDPIDDQLEPVAAGERQGPFPKQHQKGQGGPARIRSKQWYLRHPAKRREERREYQMRGKRLPREKLKRKYYRMYPHRYKRRGIGFATPAQRSKAWRAEQKADSLRRGLSRRAGLELLAEAMELLGFDFAGGNWPADWNTHVKKTGPPGELGQNYGKGQSRDTGTPRTDPSKQQGESLRAPNLHDKHQKGLFTQHEPPASGAINTPTTNNPTDGSGKVLPMEWYSDAVNNTQLVPDGRQDRYLHNNNFEVKQATREFIRGLLRPEFGVGVRSTFGVERGHDRVAMTVGDVLKRCEKKIKERSKAYAPKLARIDTKNWIWHWSVGDHTVRVQAFKRGTATNFPKLNLRVSCSCPFWRWWGPAHWATRDDYQKGAAPGTAEYPQIRDPAHWRPVCKHAYAVLKKSGDFFVRPEKSPLRKLGARFSVDSLDAIEVVLEDQNMAARVARAAAEREIVRRVARRYVEAEES